MAGTNMEDAANDLDTSTEASRQREMYGDRGAWQGWYASVMDRKKKHWDPEDMRYHVSQRLDSQTVAAVDASVVECCQSDPPDRLWGIIPGRRGTLYYYAHSSTHIVVPTQSVIDTREIQREAHNLLLPKV